MDQPLIDASQIAFMCGGVSISIATCGDDGMPQLVRGIACKVAGDGREVTVFVPAEKSLAAQRDIAANGAIAVTFSQPSTHRTIQLKSRDAHIADLPPDGPALVDAYCDAFIAEVGQIGFKAPMVRSLLSCPPGQLVALSFCPGEAYSQTPGPNAGKALKAGE
jgi:hypothetical protein